MKDDVSYARKSTHIWNFDRRQWNSLNVGVIGDGSVIQTPLADPFGRYRSGQTVQLQAVPNSADGWRFGRWLGDLTGRTNPAALIMDRDKSVTARSRRLLRLEPIYIDVQ